jgi:hypothetical protein
MDIAVADYGSGTASVLLNRGGDLVVRPARAFLAHGSRALPVGGNGPDLAVWVEAVNGSYSIDAVAWGASKMTRPDGGSPGKIPAQPLPSTQAYGDVDWNGVPDIALRFSQADLARLFGDLRGRHEVDVQVEAPMVRGGLVRAPLGLRIVVTGRGSAPRTDPNPLNPAGLLRFQTPAVGGISIRIFDVRGRMVRTILKDARLPAGEQSVWIDGVDDRGRDLPSGVYYYLIEGNELRASGRLTILR